MTAFDTAAPHPAFDDPWGFDGFAFLEFGAVEAGPTGKLLSGLGFRLIGARDDLLVLRQGEIGVIVNAIPGSAARTYAEMHGPALAGLGLRVRSPDAAWARAIAAGATPTTGPGQEILPGPLAPRSVKGIGGTTLYFAGAGEDPVAALLEHCAPPPAGTEAPAPFLRAIDHITFNVLPGNRAYWARFLGDAFRFRNVFEADLIVDGSRTRTTVMQSPCNRISLACNEPAGADSPLYEQMRRFNGEGMQHLAFLTDDILAAAARLDAAGLPVLPAPPDHHARVRAAHPRLPLDLAALQAKDVLIDGEERDGIPAFILQRFTRPVLGPAFFEFVQRVNFPEGFVQRTAEALLKAVAASPAAPER